VKTASLGSLCELLYRIMMKDDTRQKVLGNRLRCRSGNNAVSIGGTYRWKEEV